MKTTDHSHTVLHMIDSLIANTGLVLERHPTNANRRTGITAIDWTPHQPNNPELPIRSR